MAGLVVTVGLLTGCAEAAPVAGDVGTSGSPLATGRTASPSLAAAPSQPSRGNAALSLRFEVPSGCDVPLTQKAASTRLSQWAGATADAKQTRSLLRAAFAHDAALLRRNLVTQDVLRASKELKEKTSAFIAGIDVAPVERDQRCALLRQEVAELALVTGMVDDQRLMTSLPESSKGLSNAESQRVSKGLFANFLIYPTVQPEAWAPFEVSLPVDDRQISSHVVRSSTGEPTVVTEYLEAQTFLTLSCTAKLSGFATSCDMSGLARPNG